MSDQEWLRIVFLAFAAGFCLAIPIGMKISEWLHAAKRRAIQRVIATTPTPDPRFCKHGEWRGECLDCIDGGYGTTK